MKRPALFLAALLSCLLLSAAPTRALTTIPRDLDQLVTRADAVFKGKVTAMNSLWVGTGENRHIATRVTFQVAETYKGQAATEQTLEFVGGTVDGETMEIPDTPRFEIGQTSVLFVVGNGKQFCPLVGINQGRFHVVKDAASGAERIFTDDHTPLVHTADLGQVDERGEPRTRSAARLKGATAMTADSFRAEVLEKVKAIAR